MRVWIGDVDSAMVPYFELTLRFGGGVCTGIAGISLCWTASGRHCWLLRSRRRNSIGSMDRASIDLQSTVVTVGATDGEAR
jgi:hypothetical protein